MSKEEEPGMARKLLKSIVGSFTGKAGEKAVDYVVDTGKTAINFKSSLQHLQRNTKRLRDKASDVETAIKNQELDGRKKRKKEVNEWLDKVQEMIMDLHVLEKKVEEKGLISRFVDGDRVSRLNAIVEGLIEQSQHFEQPLVLDACEARGKPFLKSKLFGRNEALKRIWEWLVVGKVSPIGIHGISGVGKTALAKQIHNRILEETRDHVYWVRVSQDFNIKKLQDEIARVVGLSLSQEDFEERRASVLHRVLTERKDFVLILDDVHEDLSLESVGYPLGVDGCRLIITTPSLKVCHQNGCQENFGLNGLEFDEAWDLFKETLGNMTMQSSEVQENGRLITQKCGGLPQRIITLAQSMRGVTQIQEWRNALLELGG